MGEKLERSHIIFIAPKSCPGFPHALEGLPANRAATGLFKGGPEGRLCAAGGRLTAGRAPRPGHAGGGVGWGGGSIPVFTRDL